MSFQKFYVSQIDASNPNQLQRTINTIQQNVEDEFDSIENKGLLSNVIYDNVTINTSNNLMHKLGRVPAGYLIIKKNANVNIWDAGITDTQLTLVSSGAVQVSVLVF